LCRYHYKLINPEESNKFLINCPFNVNFTNEEKGKTLDKAIFEHNLISLSKIYDSISFYTLESFLMCDINKILNYTFKMIIDNKIRAHIDEINEFIVFEAEPSNSSMFDMQIQNFCLKVLQITEYMRKK